MLHILKVFSNFLMTNIIVQFESQSFAGSVENKGELNNTNKNDSSLSQLIELVTHDESISGENKLQKLLSVIGVETQSSELINNINEIQNNTRNSLNDLISTLPSETNQGPVNENGIATGGGTVRITSIEKNKLEEADVKSEPTEQETGEVDGNGEATGNGDTTVSTPDGWGDEATDIVVTPEEAVKINNQIQGNTDKTAATVVNTINNLNK